MAAGLAVQGAKIERVEGLELLDTGVLQAVPSTVAGARIHFRKANGSAASLIYMPFLGKLTDANQDREAKYAKLLTQVSFDTVYTNAGRYLLRDGDYSFLKSQVLSKAKFIVQSDDGLPFFEVLAQNRLEFDWEWKAKLFGFYSAPNPVLGLLKDHRSADIYTKAVIAAGGQFGASELMPLIANDVANLRKRANPNAIAEAEWRGRLPFFFSYRNERLKGVEEALQPWRGNFEYLVKVPRR